MTTILSIRWLPPVGLPVTGLVAELRPAVCKAWAWVGEKAPDLDFGVVWEGGGGGGTIRVEAMAQRGRRGGEGGERRWVPWLLSLRRRRGDCGRGDGMGEHQSLRPSPTATGVHEMGELLARVVEVREYRYAGLGDAARKAETGTCACSLGGRP